MKGILSITGIVLSAFILIGVYYYLSKSPYLEIKEITIEGGKRVSSEEVMDIAGVKTGENTLDLDLKAIKNRIEKLPWVREAVVQRVLPHNLKISIKERMPFALINLDSTLYVIDDRGVVFKRADYRDRIDLPIITGVRMEKLLVRDEDATRFLFEALDFLRFLEKNRAISVEFVSEVKMDVHMGLTVYTTQDPRIIIFGKGNFERKLQRLKKLMIILKDDIRKVRAIDLNYDKKAIVQWKT